MFPYSNLLLSDLLANEAYLVWVSEEKFPLFQYVPSSLPKWLNTEDLLWSNQIIKNKTVQDPGSETKLIFSPTVPIWSTRPTQTTQCRRSAAVEAQLYRAWKKLPRVSDWIDFQSCNLLGVWSLASISANRDSNEMDRCYKQLLAYVQHTG